MAGEGESRDHAAGVISTSPAKLDGAGMGEPLVAHSRKVKADCFFHEMLDLLALRD